VGVGGSGKQSLTRLAASVSGLEVFQIQLRKGYSTGDLKVSVYAHVTHTVCSRSVCIASIVCRVGMQQTLS